MSEEQLASYAFLPWMRRGVSTEITRTDGAGPAAPRAAIPIQVTLNTDAGPRSATANLALYGPGEVTGIDPRLIIRTFPKANVHDAESNTFPAIEFDQPDFPWRYTPARANPGERLRPWIALIALADDEIEAFQAAGADGAPPVVTVKSAASLPDLGQSWAWAHVQVSGFDPARDGSIASVVENEPQRALARLLCPRRLTPRTAYTALLVPAFERGRRAALGEDLDETTDGLDPAWTSDGASVRLPVYYQWRFETGAEGDFEFLVRQLRARALPATVGIRDMDVSDPGMALPPAASTPLGLEGALMSLAARSTPWDPAERDPFVSDLAGLVNRPTILLESGDPTRIVAPPLYGQWHAGQDRLQPDQPPPWFNDLNADPRTRTTAGLGTQVVQDQQQQLMASAWDQVEGVLALNEKLRQAQLARELAERVRVRHMMPHDAETALLITAPLHSRLRASPTTIRAAVSASPIADGALEGQFRRVARPLGRVGRRQGRPAAPRVTTLLGRMNRGELSPASPPPTPETLATPSRTGAGLAPDWATPGIVRLLKRLPLWLVVLAVVLIVLALLVLVLGASILVGIVLAVLGIAALAGAEAARRLARRIRAPTGLRDGTLTGRDIRDLPAAPGFVPAEAPPGSHTPTLPTGPAPGAEPDPATRRAIDNFRGALAAALDQIAAPPAAGPVLRPVNIARLRETILAGVDPRETVVASLHGRLKVADWIVWQPEDPLEPVLAIPTFDQPMYEPLRDLSQDWLLPGVDEIPANTASLLTTNQEFIESYMVGLSHEMARELRYHEYPARIGTYFRQFWDVRGYVPPPGASLDPETLKDIKPVEIWGGSAALGANSSRTPPPGGEHLVLLIRGEVLRRYPNTIVYANNAVRGANGLREMGDEQRFPVFQGTLQPDISFFGFELTPEQVHGSTDPDADQGWFFVLQEHITEPKFGLDLPESYGGQITAWQDLSWGHLAASAAELDGLTHIDLNASRPDTRLVTTPAGEPAAAWHADSGLGPTGTRGSDIAYITLQRPFRVAIHGSDMLPD